MASMVEDEESPAASSGNDEDDMMEDVENVYLAGNGDGEVDENEENDDEEDPDVSETRGALRGQNDNHDQVTTPIHADRPPSRPGSGLHNDQGDHSPNRTNRAPTERASRSPASLPIPVRDISQPRVRKEALMATIYDIAPTIAAPHSTSINAVTATSDMRWVFSAGADGWIRKFDWLDTVNAKTMLTVAQRHPFVDSVTKAGVLASYWENEEPSDRTMNSSEAPPLSAAYSLAVQRQALWLLSGTEVGAINLQSVRHDEGKRITSLYKHTSAVSVMSLSSDELSFLSGSWDKTILDWDLNTGQTKRSYLGSGSQISAIEIRPNSVIPVPSDSLISDVTDIATDVHTMSRKESLSGNEEKDMGKSTRTPFDAAGSPTDSLFNDDGDHNSLFGETRADGASNLLLSGDDDNEFSRAIASDITMQGSNTVDDDDDTTTIALEASNITNGPNLDMAPDSHGAAAKSSSSTLQDLGNHFSDEKGPSPKSPGASGLDDHNIASESTFLDAAIDGTLRIWDRRQPDPIAKIAPHNAPPWCMHASWSPDGNSIYAGRRNGTVDEYSMHKSLRQPERSLKFPSGSGPVSAVRAMPNAKHIICASHDILRLYDLEDRESAKHSRVPFLIVPGHRTGVVSHLYIDPTCSYLISTGGNRGWEGASTEVLLGYEIGVGH